MRIAICEKFKWDYQTFENQPPFFIDEIVIHLNQEANRSKHEERKNQLKKSNGGIRR